jgi:hypothetical protein
MSSKNWHGVPQESADAWRRVFNSVAPEEIMHLSADCPVCGNQSLHRYFSLEKEQPRELRGLIYRGPGSYWEWCSSCHSFEHMSGYVPVWWDIDPLNIDHAQLTAIPDLIDDAINPRE